MLRKMMSLKSKRKFYIKNMITNILLFDYVENDNRNNIRNLNNQK